MKYTILIIRKVMMNEKLFENEQSVFENGQFFQRHIL